MASLVKTYGLRGVSCSQLRRLNLRVMSKRPLNLVVKIAEVFAIASILAVSYSSAVAQSMTPSSINAEKGSADEKTPFASIEEEMRAKSAIKFGDKAYQENLERARELSFIGAAISTSFKQKNSLDREDLKKLEKAEKLAKGIRNAAGGSEDEVQMEKPPKDLASALTMFAELTGSLKSKVEKTPKHVVSAAVIDEANVLLELIRMVRSLPPKV